MAMLRHSVPVELPPEFDRVIRIKSMARPLNTPDPEGEKPPSFGTREWLFALLLLVLFFLLGQSMVHHRFFQGGRVHRNGSVGQ
jgi:hypothetical protein